MHFKKSFRTQYIKCLEYKAYILIDRIQINIYKYNQYNTMDSIKCILHNVHDTFHRVQFTIYKAYDRRYISEGIMQCEQCIQCTNSKKRKT